MDIKISNNWLRDYLKTEVKPEELGQLLSYCGPSVEYVNKVGKDFVYEIEITTNRPDMMSVIGIAREANAILKSFGKKVNFTYRGTKPRGGSLRGLVPLGLNVKIQDKSLCPRFTAIILDNIKVTSSSKWMRERLEASGIRSLNNVVDISNYVMLETGQPIHIFDYDKIKGQAMVLRKSKEGELITTIDKVERKLPKGAIVIEDSERLIDLCGIMGGANSAVSVETKRVVVFVQAYDPLLIRKTCQSLGFWTEAARRFEKGIDLEGIIPALWRVVELLKVTASAQVRSQLIDIKNIEQKEKKVGVGFSKIEKLIGIKITPQKIVSILTSLGFKVKIKKNNLEVIVPSWRFNDINIAEDIVEEIARVYGYHNLPSILPPNQILEQGVNSEFFWEKRVKRLLRYLGFSEVYNYSFISAKDLKDFNLNQDEVVKIANPLNLDWEYMRPSLIPSIIKNITENKANFEKIKIFELSNIYLKKAKNILPEETLTLAGALVDKTDKNLFLKIKGVLEVLFEELGLNDIVFESGKGVVNIILRKEIVGYFGAFSNGLMIFNLNFLKLIKFANSEKEYKSISKYPLIKMDIAVIVDERVLYKDLLIAMKKVGGALVKNIELFDIYRGQQIGSDKKSLAFRITYGSDNKTLLAEEAKEVQAKIIQVLENELNAKVRDGT